jgi:hypothetical protein
MKCPCGKPLHYPESRAKKVMQDIVKRKGEFTRVIWDKVYLVSRHYIALHNLKKEDLPRLAELGLVQIEENIPEPEKVSEGPT